VFGDPSIRLRSSPQQQGWAEPSVTITNGHRVTLLAHISPTMEEETYAHVEVILQSLADDVPTVLQGYIKSKHLVDPDQAFAFLRTTPFGTACVFLRQAPQESAFVEPRTALLHGMDNVYVRCDSASVR
jgi:hypothetical protein